MRTPDGEDYSPPNLTSKNSLVNYHQNDDGSFLPRVVEYSHFKSINQIDTARFGRIEDSAKLRSPKISAQLKIELSANRLKPLIAAKAKERQAEFYGNQHTGGLRENSHEVQEKGRTDETLAQISGISSNSIRRAETIVSQGKQFVRFLANWKNKESRAINPRLLLVISLQG